MGRAIAAVVAAFLLWTVLWLGFSLALQAVFPDAVAPAQPITDTGILVGYVIYSAAISAVSGWVCAAVRGGPSPMRTVWVLAIILLVVGLGVEITGWDLAPAWYHLVFLALLVPATIAGGRLKADGTA